jgi:resuscitation-promoting factor RpfB
MDGNSSERGRHRHRAHSDEPAVEGLPQWTTPSSAPDRREWTAADQWVPEPRSWFEKADRPDPGLTTPATPPPWAPALQQPAAQDHAPEPWAPAGWTPQAAAELTGPIDMAGLDLGAEPPVARWGAAPEPVAAGATRAEVPPTRAVKHPLRLALFALVLIGLVAGSAAWLTMDKSVRLTVDGEARTVSTYASTVSGVLDDAGVTVNEHDTLAPAQDAKISDGAEIVLRRGRQVTLTVDGTRKTVWVTATTVEEALSQVGYRQDGMYVSANRSTRLPLDGYELTLRTPKQVTFVADGRKHPVTTTAPTVGEAMREAGVTVDADDKVSQLADAPVRPGMTVTVTRVATRTRTTQATVEFETIEQTDAKAEPGSRTVKTKGVTGLRQVTRVETYVDGKLTSSKVAKVTVLREPVDEVVVVGPEPEAPPPAQPAGCADFPTTGGLNWCGLAQCESGLNPNAYNPAGPYYGLYQFDQGTWTANGGSGSPSGKSIAEQTAVAWTLYQARGASPWPVCGRNL